MSMLRSIYLRINWDWKLQWMESLYIRSQNIIYMDSVVKTKNELISLTSYKEYEDMHKIINQALKVTKMHL